MHFVLAVFANFEACHLATFQWHGSNMNGINNRRRGQVVGDRGWSKEGGGEMSSHLCGIAHAA